LPLGGKAGKLAFRSREVKESAGGRPFS
jgi:hypothetical protein